MSGGAGGGGGGQGEGGECEWGCGGMFVLITRQ